MTSLRTHQLLFLATTLLACSCAHAASFNCKAAKTPQEKAICASPALSKLDDQLAAAYKLQLDAAPQSMHNELRNDERGFLQSIAMSCTRQDDLAKIASCIKPQYELRIGLLEKSVVHFSGQTFVNRSVTLIGKDSVEVSGDNEVNPGFGTITATWPQSANPSPAWTTWNAAITRATQDEANPDAEAKKPILAKPIAWKEKWAADTESDIYAKLTLVSDKLVSARIENDSMGHGAAHPNEGWMYFHWLLAQRRELASEDIFKSGEEWHSFLAAKCLAALNKQQKKEDFLYDPAQVTGGIADALSTPRNWSLSAKGLTVVFPEYSVSPRAMPADDVLVPWSDLTPFLAADFILPR